MMRRSRPPEPELIPLPSQIQQQLLKQPESGMGYQYVCFTLDDDTELLAVVLNTNRAMWYPQRGTFPVDRLTKAEVME